MAARSEYDQFAIGRPKEDGGVVVQIPLQSAIVTVVVAMKGGHHHLACEVVGGLSLAVTDSNISTHVDPPDVRLITDIVEASRKKHPALGNLRFISDDRFVYGVISGVELVAIAESCMGYIGQSTSEAVNKTLELWHRAAEEFGTDREMLALFHESPLS